VLVLVELEILHKKNQAGLIGLVFLCLTGDTGIFFPTGAGDKRAIPEDADAMLRLL